MSGSLAFNKKWSFICYKYKLYCHLYVIEKYMYIFNTFILLCDTKTKPFDIQIAEIMGRHNFQVVSRYRQWSQGIVHRCNYLGS